MKTISEDIRERLFAEQFAPFTIFMADGRQFRIDTPAHAHVHPNRKFVSVYNERTLQCILPAHRISKLELETEHSK
jgi:hypothetical protein